MNYLDENLELIPELKPLYEHFKDNLYNYEFAKNNFPTLKVNDIYLHSKYDPLTEAKRVVDFLLKDKEELDVIIIFGAGLGYIPRILYKEFIKKSNRRILPYLVYIEADLRCFFTSLNLFDWKDALQSENFKIFLCPDKEQIGNFLQSIPTKKIRYYFHRPSYSLNSEYYRNLLRHIEVILDRKDMNNATLSRFQKVWTHNFILNLPFFLRSNYFKKLKNIAEGATSILVAGGPTVEKVLNFLKEYQNYAIIIAVDTVFKYLIQNSIKPDILITIDPQYWNYKYLENIKLDDIIIVTDSSVYYKILRLTDIKNYFIGSSIFPMAKFFEENNEERGIIAAGGSVATTAFDVARFIGSSCIILTGLDLGYPNRMTHFKGAFFESQFIAISDFFNSAETLSFNYLTHVPLKTTKSTNNQTIYTDQKMLLFKNWFEREISITGCEVILPDLGGSLIEGAKVLPLEKILIKKYKKSVFYENVNKIKQNYQMDFNKDNLVEKVSKFLNITEDIKKITYEAINLIPENKIPDTKSIKKIEFFEKKLFENKEYKEITQIISSSAQSVLLSITENLQFDKNEVVSAWKKTKLLYESIYELTDFYIKTLKKLLKIIENSSIYKL